MPPHTTDDAPLWLALEQSWLGRLPATVSKTLVVSASFSRVGAACRRGQEQWLSVSACARMQAVGTMIVVATVVHLGLGATRPPIGSWWLIVPGTALCFGLTAIVLSRLGGSTR